MKHYLDSFWSDKYQCRLHKLGVTGTSKALICNDDDLAHLLTLIPKDIHDRINQ